MLKKMLINIFITSYIASSAFATSIFHAHDNTNRKHKISVKRNLKPSTLPTNYTDFTGTWTGLCDIPNSPESPEIQTWVIDNDEYSITVNGETTTIGELLKKSETTDYGFATDEHFVLGWTHNGEVLGAHLMVHYWSTHNWSEIDTVKTEIALIHGQLIVKSRMAFDIDLDPEPVVETCTMNPVR